MQQIEETAQKRYIYHVYREEIETENPLTVDAEEEQGQILEKTPPFTLFCLFCVGLLCIAIPFLATVLGQEYPNTSTTILSKTITLTLLLHPTKGDLPLYTLPQITETQQLTVAATGSEHVPATQATGLITFFNGAFAPQTVPAGTRLTGKDGVVVVTSQTAMLPAATPTTPPTYGMASVTAYSAISGTFGNIPASDIDQACCGTSILAQNLYGFSGGQDAKDILVLTQTDLSTGGQELSAQVEQEMDALVQRELHPGYLALPLSCSHTFSADHQAGDQAQKALLTLTETCTPLAYFAPEIVRFARQHIPVPKGYTLVSFSAYVVESHTTSKGGTLTIQAIAYLTHTERSTRLSGYRTRETGSTPLCSEKLGHVSQKFIPKRLTTVTAWRYRKQTEQKEELRSA